MPAEPPFAQVVDTDGRQSLLLDPGRDAAGQRPVEHRREQRQDVDLEGHGSDPPSGVAASSAGGPLSPIGVVAERRRGDRRRGALGRSGSGVRDRGGRRSSDSASTTISPRRGAKIRTKGRTAGRSNEPNGPPETTNTSFSPTR